MRLPHESLGGTLLAGLALTGALSLVAMWLVGG